MHSPDLSLDDDYKRKSLDQMVELLDNVQCSIVEKYADISDCKDAIANIKKVSYGIANVSFSSGD